MLTVLIFIRLVIIYKSLKKYNITSIPGKEFIEIQHTFYSETKSKTKLHNIALAHTISNFPQSKRFIRNLKKHILIFNGMYTHTYTHAGYKSVTKKSISRDPGHFCVFSTQTLTNQPTFEYLTTKLFTD